MSCTKVGLQPWIKKDPDAVADYEVDWTAQLVSGETIDLSTWSSDYGIDVLSAVPFAQAISGSKAKAWLSGGTCGESYRVTNRITTSLNHTYDKTFLIVCVEA